VVACPPATNPSSSPRRRRVAYTISSSSSGCLHHLLLTLLCSSFFRDHNKALWDETLEGFRERGQRAAAARTHAKVITLEMASGGKLAPEGSANLRSNGNREQFLLANDAGLHDWHARWIDKLVAPHEGYGAGEQGGP
jgi:hypothetical protein